MGDSDDLTSYGCNNDGNSDVMPPYRSRPDARRGLRSTNSYLQRFGEGQAPSRAGRGAALTDSTYPEVERPYRLCEPQPTTVANGRQQADYYPHSEEGQAPSWAGRGAALADSPYYTDDDDEDEDSYSMLAHNSHSSVKQGRKQANSNSTILSERRQIYIQNIIRAPSMWVLVPLRLVRFTIAVIFRFLLFMFVLPIVKPMVNGFFYYIGLILKMLDLIPNFFTKGLFWLISLPMDEKVDVPEFLLNPLSSLCAHLFKWTGQFLVLLTTAAFLITSKVFNAIRIAVKTPFAIVFGIVGFLTSFIIGGMPVGEVLFRAGDYGGKNLFTYDGDNISSTKDTTTLIIIGLMRPSSTDDQIDSTDETDTIPSWYEPATAYSRGMTGSEGDLLVKATRGLQTASDGMSNSIDNIINAVSPISSVKVKCKLIR